ncbi:Uncharacterised protein [uncultured Comamonas sp.]|nr:Uncharacterised protein [uncultured Comamonas sp.]
MTIVEKSIRDLFVKFKPTPEEIAETNRFYEESIANDLATIEVFNKTLQSIGIDEEIYSNLFLLFVRKEEFLIDDCIDYFLKSIRKECPLIDEKTALCFFSELAEYECKAMIYEDSIRPPPPGNLLLKALMIAKKYKPTMERKGAAARHKENKQAKEFIFSWLDQNNGQYKTLDDAAFAAAGKVVPYTFRTVRRWVTEWKKLRATGIE